MIYGISFVGSFIEMVLSRFFHLLRRVLTPVVTGTVVTLIGLSLIDVGITDMAGGVGAEDFGSLRNLGLAAIFITFPNTTFSQNNGVIQLTGVASRWIGYIIAGFLVLFGLFAVVGAVVTAMPRPVPGGATIVMFGTVAAAGIKIIATGGDVNRRDVLILAVSLALGLGVQLVPDALQNFPATAQAIFGSPITTGGLTAMILNVALPRDDTASSVPEVRDDVPDTAEAPGIDGFPAVTDAPEVHGTGGPTDTADDEHTDPGA